MPTHIDASTVFGLVAGVFAIALALLVMWASRANQVLVLMLMLEGAFQILNTLAESARPWPDRVSDFEMWHQAGVFYFVTSATAAIAALLLCVCYLSLASSQLTPHAERLRMEGPWMEILLLRRAEIRWGVYGTLIATATLIAFVVAVRAATGHLTLGALLDDFLLVHARQVGYGAYLLVLLFGFLASFLNYSLTPPGTSRRGRALAYLVAFGARDLSIYGSTFAVTVADMLHPDPSAYFRLNQMALAASTIVFVILLAYAIMKAQLFNIDLRLKWSISRGAVVSVALATVFVVAKIVEAYANRTLGFVAGAIAAGLLTFAAPKLNKLSDRVADAALPKVQPTSTYLAFKKLDVYRAAVESAHETGGIGERERLSLDRLRAKLGLDPADCRAIETEVLA